jgi:hypothetical protein
VRDELTQPQTLTRDCATLPAWPLSDDDLIACLAAAHQVQQQAAAIVLHLIRESRRP